MSVKNFRVFISYRHADFQDTKVLAFVVFGTVVDWRSSVIAEGEATSRRTHCLIACS